MKDTLQFGSKSPDSEDPSGTASRDDESKKEELTDEDLDSVQGGVSDAFYSGLGSKLRIPTKNSDGPCFENTFCY